MSTWQKLQGYSNPHKINYVRACGEKPSIIVPHGFTENGCCRLALAHALKDQCHSLISDQISHEHSNRLTPLGEISRMPDLTNPPESFYLEKKL